MWDACTGKLRCTYRAFNDKDEVTASNSVTFSPDGCYMAAGANKVMRLFSTAVPGAHYRSKPTHTKKTGGQPGVQSQHWEVVGSLPTTLNSHRKVERRLVIWSAGQVGIRGLVSCSRPESAIADVFAPFCPAGIISCLAFNPDNSGIIAAGAYSGVAALYDAHTLAPAAVMSGGHTAGITKVRAASILSLRKLN